MLVSAKTGAELTRLFKTVERVKSDAQQRIGTGVLNRLFTTGIALHPPAMRGGKRFKVLFVTQPEHDRPWPIPIPEFVLFVNDEKLLDDGYRRFLESHIREKAPYTGCPILFHFRPREARDKENQTRGQKFGRRPETGGKPGPRGPRPKNRNTKAGKPRARLGG
jgi:GTP-binding protein